MIFESLDDHYVACVGDRWALVGGLSVVPFHMALPRITLDTIMTYVNHNHMLVHLL